MIEILVLIAFSLVAFGAIIEGGNIIAGARSRVLQRVLGSPALGATTDVHAAVIDDGSEQTITTAITDPPTPRNITATSGGTAGDIKAIQVTINGTNEDNEVISEVLPVFTENSATTVVGSKAFKTVTSIVIPAHDGTGATTAIGLGAKLGLGFKVNQDSVVNAHLAGVRESTRPTVAVSGSAMESNTITLNSALDGSEVLVDHYLN